MIALDQVTNIQRRWKKADWDHWEARVQFHERNGNDRSDAQGMADIDCMYERQWCGTTGELLPDKLTRPEPRAGLISATKPNIVRRDA